MTDKNKLILVLTFLMGLITGGIIFPDKVLQIHYDEPLQVLCAVYNDSSMACSPLDYTGGAMWGFKTPCINQTSFWIICNYSLENRTFMNCSRVELPRK